MTGTRLTPEQIAANDRAADAFFARRRGVGALTRLLTERYSPELRAATADAKKATTWKSIHARYRDQRDAFIRATCSPLLDATSRNLLRQTRGIRRQRAAQLEKNTLAADRFFARVDGTDLSHELTAHIPYMRAQREKAAREVYRRLMASPIDPLTDEEAFTVLTKTPEALWQATLRTAAEDRTRLHEIRPAGISLERALEIAGHALDNSPD